MAMPALRFALLDRQSTARSLELLGETEKLVENCYQFD
jgi:hypothetical protein